MNRTEYQSYLARKQREHGTKFDASDLAPQFAPYLHDRQTRLKVRHPIWGECWGWVGVTTGWKPAFLLMRRINSVGSSILLDGRCEILAVRRKEA